MLITYNLTPPPTPLQPEDGHYASWNFASPKKNWNEAVGLYVYLYFPIVTIAIVFARVIYSKGIHENALFID